MNHGVMMTLIRMAHMHSNVNCSRRWLVAAIFYENQENQRREGYKYIRASTRIAYIYVYYPIVPGNIIGVSYRPSEGFKIWTSHHTMTIDLYRISHAIVTTPGETVIRPFYAFILSIPCPPPIPSFPYHPPYLINNGHIIAETIHDAAQRGDLEEMQ